MAGDPLSINVRHLFSAYQGRCLTARGLVKLLAYSIQDSSSAYASYPGAKDLVAQMLQAGEPASLVESFVAWCDRHRLVVLDVPAS